MRSDLDARIEPRRDVAALEAAGIEFIPADELKGPGVRFRHAKRVAKRRMNKP
jgi:hypothetical protein